MSDETEIRFSADDGDADGDALGIGYPQSAIDLAEAAEELSALELEDERPPRRRGQPLAALGLSALVGALLALAVAGR
jgi:hypothetical protein